MDRLTDGCRATEQRLDADAALKSRVERSLRWLVEDGATVSGALVILLAGLEAQSQATLVIDMLEEGLDAGTQQALIAFLRRCGPEAKPLFFLTRLSAILELDAVGADESITLCPANHSPPIRVMPYPGAPGYEALATCLLRQTCVRVREALSRGGQGWRELALRTVRPPGVTVVGARPA